MQSLTRSLAIPAVAQTSGYLALLADAYVILALPKFSASFKARVVAPHKYYAIDNGLRGANAPQMTPDVGPRLENAVFLELRRRGSTANCAYAGEKGTWECDFVTDAEVIQVCAEITPANRDRELRGIRGASTLPGKKRRPVILTLDQRDRMSVDSTAVDVQPAWEWMTAT